MVVLTTLLTNACIQLPSPIDNAPPGQWTARSGDTRHAAFAREHVPDQVQIAWDEGFGRGLPSTPIVHGDLIIAVVSGGGILTMSASNGEKYWGRRFNGSIAGQALRVDDRIFFATHHRSGTLYALDMRRGRRLWSRKLDARAISEPAYGGGMLYQATDRNELFGIDAANGNVLWRTRLGGVVVQPPVLLGDVLLIPSRDMLFIVPRNGGVERARHTLAGTPTAPLAVSGDTVVMVAQPGIVVAYADLGARELWRHDVGGPILTAPIMTPEGVYVMTRQAELVRVNAAGITRLAQFESAATESLTLTADGLLVGLLDGRLLLVRRDGTVAWEQQLKGSLRAPPAVSDSSIYAVTLAGRMVRLHQ